jgi:hypothetical protein
VGRVVRDAYSERLRIATHEALHALVAAKLGLGLHSVSLEPAPGEAGRALVREPRSRDEARRALAFLLAPIAHGRPLPVDHEGPGDLAQAARLREEWGADDPGLGGRRPGSRSLAAEDPEGLIRVTDALLARGELSAAEVRQLTDQRRTP